MPQRPNILLVTVTEIESKSVLNVFQKAQNIQPELRPIDDRQYHYLGDINGNDIFLLESQMGNVKLGGALQTVQKGIKALSPIAVVMVGIAFGSNPEQQRVGDILVSSQLMLYEPQKYGSENVKPRGDRVSSSPWLFNAVQSVQKYWNGAAIRLGLILTGEKVIANLKMRQRLLKLEPEAIGGEMEGAGLYLACQDAQTDWMLIKGISDWADGNKDKNRAKNQKLAAENAASFVLSILQKLSPKNNFQQGTSAVSHQTSNIVSRTKKNAKKKQTPPTKVPFVNRQEEIRTITSLSNVTHYFLVSAPIGYGKSELLEEVSKRFAMDGWCQAYIKTSHDTTLKEITQQLAKALKISLRRDDKLSWGMRLGSAWKKHVGEEEIKGLAILVDLDKEVPPNILRELIDHFIPDIHNSLNTLKSFQNSDNSFRVIIAGRQLTSLKEFRDSDNVDSWIPINLSPFTFDVVKLSASKFLGEHETHQTIDQIAAHTLYLTGGHPHCVAETLRMYLESGVSPDAFIENKKDDLWKDIYRNTIEDVKVHLLESIKMPLEILEIISVFRFLDDVAIGNVFKKYKSQFLRCGITHYIELQDMLTGSYYFSAEETEPWIISDTIARMLVSINLRHGKINNYLDYCDNASKICEERIQNEQRPYRWVVEYLFQNLQKEAVTAMTSSGRLKLREQFFNKILPDAMQLFFSSRKFTKNEVKREKEVLRKEMCNDERHWEFRFLINYFFREDQYSEEPFKRLVKDSKLWS